MGRRADSDGAGVWPFHRRSDHRRPRGPAARASVERQLLGQRQPLGPRQSVPHASRRALVGDLLRRRRRRRRRPFARRRIRDPGPARRRAGHVRAVSDVPRPRRRGPRRVAEAHAAGRHVRGLPELALARRSPLSRHARAHLDRHQLQPRRLTTPVSTSLVFAVPLLVEDIDAAAREAIHAKVSRYLESEHGKRDIEPSPEESVATSYYKREAQVVSDANLSELEHFVIATAKAFLEKTLKLPPRELQIERSWINVFEPGAQEAQHSHDGSLLSCSYYVEAPKDCGCIVMPDPIGARRSYREFTKTAGGDLLTRRDIAVEPQPGRLVMFESWLPHYVQCNKSDQVRISIAMNLREARHASGPRADPPARAAGEARDGSAASAAASRGHSSDGKPFVFDQLFEARTDLRLSLEPIRNEIPTIV